MKSNSIRPFAPFVPKPATPDQAPTQVAPQRERVVIIGGGAGGLEAARSLRKAAVDVTLINRDDRHVFQPLLFRVADGTLDPKDITVRISEQLAKQRNASFLMSAVKGIDVENHNVSLDDGRKVPYDHLIVAAGARTNYFGHESDWNSKTLALKTPDDAIKIREKIGAVFDSADLITDQAARQEALTFAIVGGGPIGIEMAGAIAERARAYGYKTIKPGDTRITVIQSGPQILDMFGKELADSGARQAQELGIDLRVDTRVTGIEDGKVQMGADSLNAKTIIWAAGAAAASLTDALPEAKDGAGRLLVESDDSLPGHPEVFAIGDIATTKDPELRVPGLWTVAQQQGKHAARNIEHRIANEPTEPFAYKDPGSMAHIGAVRALLFTHGVEADRFPAWAAWLGVHALALPTLDMRLITGAKLAAAGMRSMFLPPFPADTTPAGSG